MARGALSVRIRRLPERAGRGLRRAAGTVYGVSSRCQIPRAGAAAADRIARPVAQQRDHGRRPVPRSSSRSSDISSGRRWPTPVSDDAQPATVPGAAAPASAALEPAPRPQRPPRLRRLRSRRHRRLPRPKSRLIPISRRSAPSTKRTRRPSEGREAPEPARSVARAHGPAEEAAARYERAVVLQPLDPPISPQPRARRGQRQGSGTVRSTSIAKRCASVRRTPTACTFLGQTLQKKGDDQAAIAEFDKALKLSPTSVVGLSRTRHEPRKGRTRRRRDRRIPAFSQWCRPVLTPSGSRGTSPS